MTTLLVQDRPGAQIRKLIVAMTGCRRDILAYVAQAYPTLHVVTFA